MNEDNLIVVSTRISTDEKKLLDKLVQAGVERTRSKALRKIMLIGIDAALGDIEKEEEEKKEAEKKKEEEKEKEKEGTDTGQGVTG